MNAERDIVMANPSVCLSVALWYAAAAAATTEFRRVCYRINILGSSQLSPSSINLLPAQAGKATV